MKRQRSHYRSLPESWWSIEVELVGTDGQAHATDVMDVSGGGIRVEFDEDVAPPFDFGMQVAVRLKSDEFDQPIDAPAVIVRAEHDGVKRTFGVQFIDWMGLVASMPKSMASLFNLRADPRLTLDPLLPVQVRVSGFEGEFDIKGVLFDLSSTGLSFSTELLSQCVLNRVDFCVVDFQPPTSAMSFRLGTRIRYRCLAGESLRYGLWFDPEATENFEGQQAALGAYVDGRIRASLAYAFR